MKSIHQAMVELIPFAVVVAAIAAFWRSPAVVFVLLTSVALFMLRRERELPDLLYFGLPAILGTVGELVATASGAWSYGKPFILVPLWVPLAWGAGALSMMRMIRVILRAAAEQPLTTARSSLPPPAPAPSAEYSRS